MPRSFDPFTAAAEDSHYLLEQYRKRDAPSPVLPVFYRVKPAIPNSLQIALRRHLARRQAMRAFPAWPVEEALVRRRAEALAHELARRSTDRITIVAPWPGGARFAIALTHDVEGPRGLERIPTLLEVERKYGFVSAWNFVAEWYPLGEDIQQRIRDAGCEIGLHGITHDGALFRDRTSFEASLPKIRHYLEAWRAVGFRSPSALRNARWMHELPVGYDSSFPDTDPFQPQAGGCCWIFPFFFGDVVELPMTLDQDHTLFVLLQEQTISRWMDKSRWIIANGGLINVNVHPDYMNRRYLALYDEFLHFLSEQVGGWHALPRDVAAWWRERARLCAEFEALGEKQDAKTYEGATVTTARLDGGRIVCGR